MNIIFLGTTGIHHTLVAAQVYLGKSSIDYKKLKYWGDWIREEEGYPLFIDYDNYGNKLFSLGAHGEVLMTKKSIDQLAAILTNGNQELLTVKPVFLKRDRLLLWLYRINRISLFKQLTQPLINYLVQSELIFIKQQMNDMLD